MDLTGKNAGVVTPAKDPQVTRSKIAENSNFAENYNPNVSSPSPLIKSAKKSASRKPNPMASPQKKMRERRFVVAKKNSKKERVASSVACKCKEKNGGNGFHKCLCVAYESLKASQEEFFKNRGGEQEKECERAECEEEEGEEKNPMMKNSEIGDEYDGREVVEEEGCLVMNEEDNHDPDEIELRNETGSSTIKRRRDKLLEEARKSVPEPGSGRVMHLVQAFERLLSIPRSKDSDDKEEEKESGENDSKKVTKWALPGLQPKVPETHESLSSFCPSDLFLTSENLGLDSHVSSSWDSSQGSFSISSRTSGGGRRSRRNSSESSGTIGGSKWKKKQLKLTNQKPFKLRTEQRGRLKEEELMKKIQKMMEEEERLRIPIAQGLPWTTDEPECLVKPPVKEYTKPIDLKLHSDVRAEERAEFDQQVAEKLSLIEQYKMERERQRKLAEEEEIRRLRKVLVPKAQPMPYFDRPFIPRRSMKHPTVPKEPKFHLPQHKKIKCYLSWNDISPYTYQQ